MTERKVLNQVLRNERSTKPKYHQHPDPTTQVVTSDRLTCEFEPAAPKAHQTKRRHALASVTANMDCSGETTKLVPLRYRGSRNFAALHTDAVFGMESLSLGPSVKTKGHTLDVLKKDTNPIIVSASDRAPFEGLTTYKADFVRHDLPFEEGSQVRRRGDRVPFHATTTYRMDYRTAGLCAGDATPAAANSRAVASANSERRRIAPPGSVRGHSCRH